MDALPSKLNCFLRLEARPTCTSYCATSEGNDRELINIDWLCHAKPSDKYFVKSFKRNRKWSNFHIDQLWRERAVLEKLIGDETHPQVLGWFKNDARAGYVLKWYNGIELSVIQQEHAFTGVRRLLGSYISAIGLIKAINSLHQKYLIQHRNLSCSNILLDEVTGIAKLTNFSNSIILTEVNDRHLDLCGNIYTWSPEVLRLHGSRIADMYNTEINFDPPDNNQRDLNIKKEHMNKSINSNIKSDTNEMSIDEKQSLGSYSITQPQNDTNLSNNLSKRMNRFPMARIHNEGNIVFADNNRFIVEDYTSQNNNQVYESISTNSLDHRRKMYDRSKLLGPYNRLLNTRDSLSGVDILTAQQAEEIKSLELDYNNEISSNSSVEDSDVIYDMHKNIDVDIYKILGTVTSCNNYGIAADVWALGIILWEIIFLSPPSGSRWNIKQIITAAIKPPVSSKKANSSLNSIFGNNLLEVFKQTNNDNICEEILYAKFRHILKGALKPNELDRSEIKDISKSMLSLVTNERTNGVQVHNDNYSGWDI